MSALAILWYFLIALLIAGYFVLDGFDLGVGVLYPLICKNEEDQRIARRAIGPVWDGNEVWLLTAGGALFAAFPDAYATTFSGFYLAIMLVLFALIVRAVCFEFYEGDPRWRPVWNVCFFVGSLIPALLFGVAIGNVVYGIPMDAQGNYIGVPLLGLLSPFTLVCGLLGLAMFMSAGACWLALKAPLGSAIQMRAEKARTNMQWASIIVFILLTILTFIALPEHGIEVAPTPICLLAAALVIACLCGSLAIGNIGARTRIKEANLAEARAKGDTTAIVEPAEIKAASRTDLIAFVLQSAAAVALVALFVATMFPVIVNASPDSIGGPITAFTAGASDLSLTCMTVILAIGLPLVLIYHIIIYRTFRGRVQI